MLNFYAFSLIELLVSIVIVGILFFAISFPIYLSYKERAYTASLLNEVRACFYEIMDYCETHANSNINLDNIKACHNHTSLYGNITFNIEDESKCEGNFLPNGFKVKSYFSNRDMVYYATCEFHNFGVKCSIESK